MSKYTLNDIKFNPAPLTLCPVGQGDNADKEELKKIFQKNKELMEHQNDNSMREKCWGIGLSKRVA